MSRWKKVEYSRSKIIKSGKAIRKFEKNSIEYKNAVLVIDNWRSAHAYPLHVIYSNLRKKYQNKDIIVAERLKRLDSIASKLKREPTMSIWEMQDFGGCRVVVPKINDVYDYSKELRTSRIRHKYIGEYDYISNPKKSGYRSLYVVYEFHSDSNDYYNKNMLIEIQYRTKLQHYWATAVETMGLVSSTNIKSGEGDKNVKRFFLLISALFAHIENTPFPPNVPNNILDIKNEIIELNKEYSYLDTLSGFKIAVEDWKKIKDIMSEFDTGYCLLILDSLNNNLHLKYYKNHQFKEANDAYLNIEKMESHLNSVLVGVSSMSSLRKAYPNYFSNITQFVKIVKKHCSIS